jgi:hypothetical protein
MTSEVSPGNRAAHPSEGAIWLSLQSNSFPVLKLFVSIF